MVTVGYGWIWWITAEYGYGSVGSGMIKVLYSFGTVTIGFSLIKNQTSLFTPFTMTFLFKENLNSNDLLL
jgi:hypothetical protein